MICKKCGFEYVDGLKECPNCQTPNEPEEATVLTESERDSFAGVTIEDVGNEAKGSDYKVYEEKQQEEERRQENPQFRVHTIGGGRSILWQIVIILLVLCFVFFILPTLAIFFIIAATAYFLYSWLF